MAKRRLAIKLFRAVALMYDKEELLQDFYFVIGFLSKPMRVTSPLIRTFYLQKHAPAWEPDPSQEVSAMACVKR